jgi:hypothetical protein
MYPIIIPDNANNKNAITEAIIYGIISGPYKLQPLRQLGQLSEYPYHMHGSVNSESVDKMT